MPETGVRQRLMAILAADAAGYSRLMAEDDRATLAALDSARDVFRAQTQAHGGRIVDTAGDSVLAVFEAASEAVAAALEIQQQLRTMSRPAARLQFRIGVHLGDVLEKPDGTVYGDGVNIAARLQALCQAGGTTVSHAVRQAVAKRVRVGFEDIGEHAVKNIAEPVRAYRMQPLATDEAPLRFEGFELRAHERRLLIDGHDAALGARAFDLLLALAQRRERLVTKQELLDLVWPGVVVEEHNITAQISSLRKLLGAHVIATVPGRGYQFVASFDAPEPSPPAGAAQPAVARHNLPEQRTRFIGRATELAELARLLTQTRLLTLTGIGGTGKTRLALQLAQAQRAAYADGVRFVDLAPLRQPERVTAACADALEIGHEFETPSAERLAQVLGGREALIVLDNCEHVRAGAAALVDAVLACPGRSRIVATSREALAVAGEQLYPVRSLSLPATTELGDVLASDAVGVFVDRARQLLPEFDVDAANAAAIVDVCERLDGIALALELAAARVTVLSVADIAARLADRFRLLTGGRSPVVRQQTLLATMQWSDELLAPDQRRLLRRLAVFAGGCTLAAATAVAQAADEYAALALLSALHDKSLLVVERGSDADLPRYAMLETVRQYAQQQLDDSGEADAARTRHAEYFLAFAESAAPELRGPQQSHWMARLRDEQENLVAAMAWCVHEPAAIDPQWGLRLAAASGRYWMFHDIELGCRLAEDALQRDRVATDTVARCQALQHVAAMHMFGGRGEAGLPPARTALAVAQRLGDIERQAFAHNTIGSCLHQVCDDEAALLHFEQACELAQSNGFVAPLSAALNNIGTLQFGAGELQAAEAALRQSLHLTRGRGDTRGALIAVHNLGRVLVDARKHTEAHGCAVEAERLLRDVGEDALRFELLEVCGCLASSLGQHEAAARFWGAGCQPLEDAGWRRPQEDVAQLTRLSALSRQAIGAHAFEQAEAAGRALDLTAAMLALRQWLEHPHSQGNVR